MLTCMPIASLLCQGENDFIYDINPQPEKVRWLGGFRVRAAAGIPDPVPFTWRWSDGSTFGLFDTINPRTGICTRQDAYKCLFPQVWMDKARSSWQRCN